MCEKQSTMCDYDEFKTRLLNSIYNKEEFDKKCGNNILDDEDEY